MVITSGSKLVNVVFCVDVTGSMDFLIESVRMGIEKVAQIYLSSRLDMRIGLVEFRDKVYARAQGDVDLDPIAGGVSTMRIAKFEGGRSFTSNTEEFAKAVSELEALGGGDTPESSFDAIATAARDSDWDDGSTRVIVHMTDAPPVIPDVDIADSEQLRKVVSECQIDQIFVIAQMGDHHHYASLANATARNDQFTLLSLHEITTDVERMVRVLEDVAKTSSEGIEDDMGTELEVPEEISENPFDDQDEDEVEIEEGPEWEDDEDNPFA